MKNATLPRFELFSAIDEDEAGDTFAPANMRPLDDDEFITDALSHYSVTILDVECITL